MATISQFDPLTSEALSPFLAGLSEGLSRLSAILNLTTTTITDSAMSEVYIGEDDRYKIYQVAEGNRLWLSDPAPVVKKNGTTITPVGANFTIDYIGGSIKFETTARLISTDVVTVSATRINNASTEINDIKSDVTAVEAITAHFMGYYATLSDLETAHVTGVDGDFAIIGGTVDSIYIWDSTGSAWKDIYKTVDLSTYYTKTEADTLLSAKEASITAHGGTSASDLYYYGGRKTWQELTARVRATVLTGIDVATSAIVSASDTVLGAIGKLQAQITGKPFLSGTGDPTTATVGTIGQRYVNTSTGAVFRCTTIVDTTYTWVKQGSTSDLVDSNVTNAKLASMADNTIKGNVSGDAVAPSDLTVEQVRGIITEGTTEVDAIDDGDKFVIEDVSSTAGVRTKHVLWSAIITALRSIFMPDDAVSSNLIINGGFQVWQRGTSLSAGAGAYLADRWSDTAMTATIAPSCQSFTVGQTDVDGEPEFFHRAVVVAGNNAASFAQTMQRIEDVRSFAGKTITISFWAKADASRYISIEFAQVFGTGGSPSASVEVIGAEKIALTTSWQRISRTIAIPSISGKTLGTTANTSYLQFTIWYDSGSTNATRASDIGYQSGTFDIANVQLNYGSVALPFVPLEYKDVLRSCLRYAYKNYTLGVNYHFGTGTAYNTTNCYLSIPVPESLRVCPSGVFTGNLSLFGAGGEHSVSSISIVGMSYGSLNFLAASTGLTSGNTYYLKNTSVTASILFDSEL